ncbi:uncharacterized protein TM35_000341100 [Trypanosoma theileri]|uniref:Elks delta-like protein n=1 Tax=Trypanosoma theileri TaxID=67003 RepID=A0A1X0NLT9_9TRYP|nr:uncharacterized protein TM35_000341100 [Trypanosoma theileri]ORC85498.1 hypothetical protein TM35_000341100 [Trypanosoma theileri]
MDERQIIAVRELRKQLQEIEDALAAQEKLLHGRNQGMATLSSRIAETTNSVEESEKELRVAQEHFEDAERENNVVRSERVRITQISENHLQRDIYVREISEADEGLREIQSQLESIGDQVEILNGTHEDANTRKRLTLVSLISMLDNLHASLTRSVQCVSYEEDNRAREVLKALRELSREREKAFGYCLRKKREVAAIIELKKQRTNELVLDSQKNLSLLRENQEKTTLGVVEEIQAERKMLQEEIESIQSANQKLWDTLRYTKYSSDTVQSGDHKREAAVSANDALQGSPDLEIEKDHLREQLKLFDAKKNKLHRMTEELRSSTNAEMEKKTQKLRDLRREVHVQQRESNKIEGESRKLKSLCDSLVASLGEGR